jgi:SAM-dependent methyltransferase
MATRAAYNFGRWQQRRLEETVGRPIQAAEPEVLRRLQARLDELLATKTSPVEVLDAGCGMRRPVPIAEDIHLVGIDISPEQIAKNTEVDEAILGDIQLYRFEPETFDIVVCWNVLEHVEDPQAALLNLKEALTPDGLLLLAGPHPHSFKGLITAVTPLWVHKLVWRRLLHDEPNLDRFMTFMEQAALPERLVEFAGHNGLSVEMFSLYEGWEQRSLRKRKGAIGILFRAALRAVATISLGAVCVDTTDFVLLMKKA